MRNCLAAVVLLICCGFVAGPQHPPPSVQAFEVGPASWYGDPFHGQLTANGEIYDMFEMTAAHPSLPFGTAVRVTNIRSGRSAVVRINDRGPFIGQRILDLSYAAARHLKLVWPGEAEVRLDLVDPETQQASLFPLWPPPQVNADSELARAFTAAD
jgi:rare lipoprotein A (peptidoglycan hydrolase)